MAASGLVKALWVGGFTAELPGGIELIHGVTEHLISEGEANQSDNWQPVKPAKSTEKDA